MKATTVQSVAILASLGVTAWLVAPAIARNYRHTGSTLGEGLTAAWRSAKRLYAVASEEFEDIVTDAQLKRIYRATERETELTF